MTMNAHPILPDDPRLTAYALDEMEADERSQFEQLLQHDATAQAAVAEIRATTQALASALEHEPAPMTTPLASSAGHNTAKAEGGLPRSAGKILQFPQLYFYVSGLAAACFALFFAYWQEHQTLHEAKQYIEVDLADAKVAKKEAVLAMNLPTAPASTALNLPVAEPAPRVQDDAESAVVRATIPGGAMVEKDTEFGSNAADGVPAVAISRGDTFKSLQSSEVRYYGAVRFDPNLMREARHQSNTEAYSRLDENPFLVVAQNPLSTFSIDVDTASYANIRRFLAQGQLPPRDAVRIEELVNYFPYHYAPPARDSRAEAAVPPFAASMETASAPWAPEHRLVRIGLKGREVSDAARPPANLVFLLDVSGSMDEPNKLPLVKQSMKLLLGKLHPEDHVAIVVYAGASGLALPSTSVREQAKIIDAIDSLQAEGSTNGAAGIQLAYDIAKANFVSGGINRVILATDGDFNVGVSSEGELTRLIEEKAKSGVFLTVLGFGMGNYKDATLQKLADKGNGNYAYIDTAAEARKALVEQAGGTLMTIAKDVKIQVEFNPARVQAYRLIGYEKRMLHNEDFNNDKIDAGEIGAGHTVTALYEVVPVGAPAPDAGGKVDPLKYQTPEERRGPVLSDSVELLTLKVRYKELAGDVSSKLEFPLRDEGKSFEAASADFKFAAAVASFGMILRDSPNKGSATLADVTNWARAGLEQDIGGYRSEFLGLVKQAQALTAN
jgi:Ca-activated chloride channel homolog